MEKFNDRFIKLKKLKKFTDCAFKVENQIINCHKLILSAASPVFEAMFYGNFDINNSIGITDITYKSFDLFIEYLYTGNLKLNEFDEIESLLGVASCAQKYMIDDLRKKCVSRLRQLLSRENVFKFFTKAFECQLEDLIVPCLYFFVDTLESNISLCNVIINRNTNELSADCFEFLVKNLLDYFGERHEGVLVLIKAWTLHPAIKTLEGDEVANKLNLDNLLTEKIVQMKAAFFDVSSKIPKSFHRIYYKPVRPFIVERSQNYFDTNISFRKFVIVKNFMINSRLIPEQYDVCDMNNQTYEENIEVEIFEKSTNQIIFKNHQIIENVAFNGSFQVKISDRMVLFPYLNYVVRFKWCENEAIGFEYPRCIFSQFEKADRTTNSSSSDNKQSSVVQFHDYNFNLPLGSIVQGIFYDIIN